MFKLNNRKTLIDLVIPPPGYRFERGIATTYTLDLPTLLRILLALQSYNAESGLDSDPFALLQTITKVINKGNLLVFCNRGQIQSFKNDALVKLLDNIICDITIDNGKFHPKIWFLKYTWKEGAREKHKSIYRFICTSKNITDSEYLETSFVVDGVQNKQTRNRNKKLYNLLKDVFLYIDSSKVKKDRYHNLIKDVQSVDFEKPGYGFECYYQFGQKRRKRLMHEFNLEKVARAAIVSPFLSNDFIKSVSEKVKDVMIVSSQNALDALSTKVYETYIKNNKNVFVLAEEIKNNGASKEANISSVALHAKIYILERGDRCEIWLGSANATHNGWQANNAEAMVCVKANYSINRFNNEFIYKKNNVLNGYLSRYSRQEIDGKKSKEEQNLEKIISIVSSYEFTLSYIKNERKVRISMHSPEDVSKDNFDLLKDVGIWVKLYGFGQEHKIANNSMVVIHGVAIEDISGLLEVTVKYKSLANKVVLIARSNLHEYKREREMAVCRKRISSKNELKEYIRHILLEDRISFRRGDFLTPKPSIRKGRPYRPMLYDLSMEEILLKYDSEKVEEINRILNSVGKDKLDKEILLFWENFQKVFSGHKR